MGHCCFCCKEFEGMGNSTWGCWSEEEEAQNKGEHSRCCDECNMNVVVPARLRLFNNKKLEKDESTERR